MDDYEMNGREEARADEEAEVIVLGKPYRVDDYNLRFLYEDDSTEPTHFIIKANRRW